MIYEPQEDSFLLLKHIKDYAKGKVLDIGTSSGILAEEAMKYTKDVLAVDINDEAVEYCKKKNINTIKSDLFSNVKGKFDLIIFNPPYLPEEKSEDIKTKKLLSGGKKGHEILERFFAKAYKFLKKDGKILLVFSSMTKRDNIDKIITNNDFRFKLLDSEKLFFEELYVYLVYNEQSKF